MAKKNAVVNEEPVVEEGAVEDVSAEEPTSNAKVLDTGKNGKYEVLLVETKNKKSVVLVEKVLEKPAQGYVIYPIGQRLTVSSDMVS